MGALFITATGTDIGKTFVAAGIVRALRARGRPVDALKPVISGFRMEDAAASDAGVLLAALGRPGSPGEIARISPWRFEAPLSPDMAARREGAVLDFDALVGASHQAIAAAKGALLIEGVGGVMVPLDDRHTVLDWMAALGIPVILVAGSYLGTISHSLTALDVLGRRGVAVRATVISESPASGVGLDETVETVGRFAGVPVLGLPRLPEGATGHAVLERLADLA